MGGQELPQVEIGQIVALDEAAYADLHLNRLPLSAMGRELSDAGAARLEQEAG